MSALMPCQGIKCNNHVSMLVELAVFEARSGVGPKLLTNSKLLCADCAIDHLKDVHTALMLGSIKEKQVNPTARPEHKMQAKDYTWDGLAEEHGD